MRCYEKWDEISKQPRDNRDNIIRTEWYVWALDIDRETWARIMPPTKLDFEYPDNIFTIRHMKNQRFWRNDLDNTPRLKHPNEMPPKPPLWPEKFPEYRKMKIADALKTKIDKEKRNRWQWDKEKFDLYFGN